MQSRDFHYQSVKVPEPEIPKKINEYFDEKLNHVIVVYDKRYAEGSVKTIL